MTSETRNIIAELTCHLHQTGKSSALSVWYNGEIAPRKTHYLKGNHYIFMSFLCCFKLNESRYPRLLFRVWQPSLLHKRTWAALDDDDDEIWLLWNICLPKEASRREVRGEWGDAGTGQVCTWKQWLMIFSCLNLQQLGICTMVVNVVYQLIHTGRVTCYCCLTVTGTPIFLFITEIKQ